MLARWFDRSGIGQFVAPDSEAESVSENDESSSHFWNLGTLLLNLYKMKIENMSFIYFVIHS